MASSAVMQRRPTPSSSSCCRMSNRSKSGHEQHRPAAPDQGTILSATVRGHTMLLLPWKGCRLCAPLSAQSKDEASSTPWSWMRFDCSLEKQGIIGVPHWRHLSSGLWASDSAPRPPDASVMHTVQMAGPQMRP